MKKILPLLAISILVLSGLGAMALKDGIYTTPKQLSKIYENEIIVEGGLSGYTVTLSNARDHLLIGNISINVSTNSWFMIAGKELRMGPEQFNITPGESLVFKLRPVIGFGPAKIQISGRVDMDCCPPTHIYTYNFDSVADGFVLLFFVTCKTIPINLP